LRLSIYCNFMSLVRQRLDRDDFSQAVSPSVPRIYKMLLRAPHAFQHFLLKTLKLSAAVERSFLFTVFSNSFFLTRRLFRHCQRGIRISFTFSLLYLYFPIDLDYCYSQCGTAGFLEASRLWCCGCSSHLMLLSAAYAGQKGMEEQLCCTPVDSNRNILLRSTSFVMLVRDKSAETSRVALSLPCLPPRLSVRNKTPLITLSVSYSYLKNVCASG